MIPAYLSDEIKVSSEHEINSIMTARKSIWKGFLTTKKTLPESKEVNSLFSAEYFLEPIESDKLNENATNQ